MQDIEKGPSQSEKREPKLKPQKVKNEAADRLHDSVADLKGGDDVRILLSGELESLLELGRQDRE